MCVTYNICVSFTFLLGIPPPSFPQDPLAGEKRERMSRQRRESRGRVGVGDVGKGEERAGAPSPSSPSFSSHLSTFIWKAIVLCLFNTSTV